MGKLVPVRVGHGWGERAEEGAGWCKKQCRCPAEDKESGVVGRRDVSTQGPVLSQQTPAPGIAQSSCGQGQRLSV